MNYFSIFLFLCLVTPLGCSRSPQQWTQEWILVFPTLSQKITEIEIEVTQNENLLFRKKASPKEAGGLQLPISQWLQEETAPVQVRVRAWELDCEGHVSSQASLIGEKEITQDEREEEKIEVWMISQSSVVKSQCD